MQAISFKGTPTGNVIDTETVILLLTETNTFGGGFTVTVSGGIPVINAVWDQNTPNNKAEKVYDILENTEHPAHVNASLCKDRCGSWRWRSCHASRSSLTGRRE